MKILLPIAVVFGAVAGIAAGGLLAPESEVMDETSQDDPAVEAGAAPSPDWDTKDQEQSAAADEEVDYVRLNNQFVVPIVEQDRVASLIVLSLALEADAGSTDAVFEREPKLRDEFLRVLFTHARSGGFTGSFTDEHLMRDLRTALLRSARTVLGERIRNVLLIEIVRQDL
ncbi:MAG: flagellar basal body-associated FliL family protein [Pseudomonadota bacterium]